MLFKTCKSKSFALVTIFFILFIATAGHSRTDNENEKNKKVSKVRKKSKTEWTQYRGANRDGVSASDASIKAWPADGHPHLVWKRAIGHGFSGIVLAGDQLLTACAEDSTEFLVSYNPKTGEENWRCSLGKMFVEEFGNGPRSTPTIDGDRAYILNSFGGLYCVNIKTGEEIWKVSLADRFKIRQPQRGFSTSALVLDDTVIIHAGGGEGAAFVGLDKMTGEVIWKSGDSMVSHSSPFMAIINDVKQSVFTTTRIVEKDGERQMIDETVSISADGKILWKGPSLPQVIAMPVFVPPDKVFISSSVEDGCQLLQIEAQGADTVWHNKEMRNHFNSSVYYKDHIYGFSNSTLKCLNAATAERKWTKRGYGKGSLVIADDKLIVLSDRGKLVLAEATAEGYHELAKAQVLSDKSWTSPTIEAGVLYLRNRKEMVCYDLTK